MKKALITGVTGQIGSYLAELLLSKGYEVWGLIRRTSIINTQRIDHLYQDPHEGNTKFHLVRGDLSDQSSLINAICESDPDEIYHLAAMSHVQVSFQTPEYTADVVGIGTLRMLEATRNVIGSQGRFYHSSSSEMFGNSPPPQYEDTPFDPQSPYAVAKVFAHNITKNYRDWHGMYAVNGICFNTESPRRGETFVTRKISIAASKIKAGKQKCLYLGNLNAKRDWGYAEDYCKGIWASLQQDYPDDYIFATGISHTVRDFCDRCFSTLGIPLRWEGHDENEKGVDDNGRVLVAVDKKYYRPCEVHHLCGDSSKALNKLNWTAETSMEEIADIMVMADSTY